MRSKARGALQFWAPVGLLAALLYGALLGGTAAPSADVDLYRRAGEAMLAGQVPYRDFFVEYPPGGLPFFLPPALLSESSEGYAYVFASEMALVLAGALVLVAHAARSLGRFWPVAAVVYAGGALLLRSLEVSRYDAVVALALAGAAWAVATHRNALAWGLVGFGTLAKLTPVLAAIALYPLRRDRKLGALACVGVLLAGLVPAFLASPAGFAEVFSYHAERGLQIESLAASVLLKLGETEGIAFRYGALEAVGGLAEAAASTALSVTLGLLSISSLVIWREARRGRLGPVQFPRYATALLLAFLVGSKVLSPQYLVWLLPLVPLALRGAWGVGASVAFLLCCWATIAAFPAFYYSDPVLVEALNVLYAGDVPALDAGRYLSLVGNAPVYGVNPLDVLLGRNVLLLTLWVAMLAAPAVRQERRDGGGSRSWGHPLRRRRSNTT